MANIIVLGANIIEYITWRLECYNTIMNDVSENLRILNEQKQSIQNIDTVPRTHFNNHLKRIDDDIAFHNRCMGNPLFAFFVAIPKNIQTIK